MRTKILFLLIGILLSFPEFSFALMIEGSKSKWVKRLPEQINNADIVVAANFKEFTDNTKTAGRFIVKYVWKGNVNLGDEVIFVTPEKYHQYLLNIHSHNKTHELLYDSYRYIFLFGKELDYTKKYTSLQCPACFYHQEGLSVVGGTIAAAINNAFIRSFNNGYPKE